MSTLQTAWERLYQLPASLAQADSVRALVLELGRPADWAALSALWRGVQTDLDLPAPAIAVNGVDGHQLWFSLAEPVPLADAVAFLHALRIRYCGAMADARIRLFPSANGQSPAPVPALQDNGHWSAFIAPDLAAIFSEEPWLEVPPSPDAQGKVLAGSASVQATAFAAALARLLATPATSPTAAPAAAQGPSTAQAPSHHHSAKQFLLSVMNDASVPLPLRLDAAKALLPYGD